MPKNLFLFIGLMLAAVPTFGSLRFTLGSATETGTTSGCINYSGGCVVFSGTLENDGADDLFLSDTSVALTLPDGTILSPDANFFFANVPGLLCSQSDAACAFPSTYTGPIFQIDIAPGTAAAAYSGSITIFGGNNISSQSSNALANQSFQVTVTGGSPVPLQISAAPVLPAGTAGEAYPPQQFGATGGMPPYTWSAAPLPTGVSIDNTGRLSGTPAVGSQGAYIATIQVQDSQSATASVLRTLAINPQLLITSPLSLFEGSPGIPYGPIPFTASGGSGFYSWTATGLPAGLNFDASGSLSGTPTVPGPYNPQFTVTDSNNAVASVTLSVAIGRFIPPEISSVSPNPVITAAGAQTIFVSGSGFQSGASATVICANVNLTGQVTSLSSTQLSILIDLGTIAANCIVQAINPDAQGSNIFAFTLASPQITSFALPQFTFGGAWYTALYFANSTDTAIHLNVNFFADDGAPLLVPLLAGAGAVSTQGVDLNPHSTVILEAPNGGVNQEGWADVALPTGVTCYAVFRQTVVGRLDQEAVVPLTPESSQTVDLTYDETLFTTSIAFLNPTSQPETVTITAFDANGVQIGTSQQLLAPHAKVAAMLKSLAGLSGIAGNRGRAVFSVPSGAVSVLGLRFGGTEFTSIPAAPRPAVLETRTISFALPQFVFSGAWYTALYFSNTTNSPLSTLVRFVDDTGMPLPSPLTGVGTVTSRTVNLAPGATTILEFPALAAGTVTEGWAEATLPPGVTGYGVFRQTVAGRLDQEAGVPLTPESDQMADLVYDDIQSTTAVAFVNPSDQQVTVTITVFSASGSQIGTAQVMLAPHAKLATVLNSLAGLTGMDGNRGWASFSVPNGDVSVLGLRFGGTAFTSIPVAHR